MSECLPFNDSVEVINGWFDEGHIITFFTSRTEEVREVTEEWLDKCGFKYSRSNASHHRKTFYHISFLEKKLRSELEEDK